MGRPSCTGVTRCVVWGNLYLYRYVWEGRVCAPLHDYCSELADCGIVVKGLAQQILQTVVPKKLCISTCGVPICISVPNKLLEYIPAALDVLVWDIHGIPQKL